MTKYDEEALTDEDVEYLIHTLKHPTREFGLDELRKKIENSITLDNTEIDGNAVILGVVDNIEYILHVYCGDPVLPKPKYLVYLRFKKSNIQLVRVDIGGRHTNPGEKVAKAYPHIHIYNPNYSKKDKVAYRVNTEDFPNIHNIMVTFENFLKFTNIHDQSV